MDGRVPGSMPSWKGLMPPFVSVDSVLALVSYAVHCWAPRPPSAYAGAAASVVPAMARAAAAARGTARLARRREREGLIRAMVLNGHSDCMNLLLDVSLHCADAGASGPATGRDGRQFAAGGRLRSVRPGDPLAGLHRGAGVAPAASMTAGARMGT